MKLLPLDSPPLIELVAGWFGREENSQWLDFGNGVRVLTPVSLKIMAQRDLHVLRAYTDESDLPIGLVALSNVNRRSQTAASLWAVLGRKHTWAYARRAASRLLTFAFTELGLEAVGAWTMELNWPARRALEQLNFHYIGRRRQCHWIDGRSYDRLLYDLLAAEHLEKPVRRVADASIAAAPPPSLRIVPHQPEHPRAS